MAKSHFKALSTAALTIEAQPGAPVGVATLQTLALGSGNAVSASVATASTHKIAIDVNGTTYYLLVTNVA